MEKLNKIVELLDGKGSILIRNAHEYEGSKWYVHCWKGYIEVQPSIILPIRIDEEDFHRHVSVIERDVYNQRVNDLDAALDEIIEKLEVKKDGI